jgi:PAS domain S-box-containing protein
MGATPTNRERIPDPILSGELGVRASRTIGLILRTLLVILPILLASTWAAFTYAEAVAVAALLATVLGLFLLHRSGRFVETIYGLVIVLVIYGGVAVVSYGSIRSVAVLSFVGAVVVGGIFLGRNALIATVAASSLVLGGLVYAEIQGWLREPDFAISPVHWVIHTAVIASIALNVYYARTIVIEALLRARESSEHLGKVFRSNPAALLRTTLDDARILAINESYERMFGMARDKALGASMASFDLWVDPATRDAFYSRVRKADRVENMPALMKRRNSEAFEALVSAEIFEVGTERQLLSTVTDISELVRTREALRASVDRFEKIFRSNPAALTVTNMETRELISANEAAVRIFGDAAEDVVGRSVGTRYWADPQDAARLRARALAEGRVPRTPVRLLRGNGEPFEALISLEIFEDRSQRFLISLMEDVSEEYVARRALQASEARFSQIFRSNPAALITVDLEDSRITDVNATFERMFGVRRDEAIGAVAGSFNLWGNPEERVAFLARLHAEGRVENLPAIMRRRSGEPFEALLSAEIMSLGDVRQILSTVTDISELVRARAALRSSEERFAKIFRANPAAMIVTNFETQKMVSANDATERVFRVPVETLVGSEVAARFVLDPDRLRELRGRLVAEGRLYRVPLKMRRGDGAVFDALGSVELVEDSGQRFAISLVEDVSEEVAAREALKASEARFSSAFRFSPIGMTITRLSDGMLLEVNDADRLTLGYERDEVIGRRSTQTGAWLSVEDRNRFVARLDAEGVVQGYETRMRNKAGEMVDCMLWAAKVDLNGEACVLAATMNISERKREEALLLAIARGVSGETGTPFFRSLVEHLAHALRADIAIVGEIIPGNRVRTLAMLRDGAIVPDIEYSLEGTPCNTTGDRTGLTLYADRVAELFPQDEALARGGMRGYVGIALRDPEGTPIGVLNIVCRSSVEHSERTEALFMIFAARAQAELLRMRRDREIAALNESLELRVAERTEQLEAANRELEAFSYSVSHDLRAPLRAIDGFVRVLAGEQGQVDEALRARAQARVLAATARMNRLIEDLIGLSRVAQQPLNLDRVDLGALARETGELHREREPGRAVEFVMADALEARCDRALMRIVLDNLVGNAWKFTGRRENARIEFGREDLPGGERAFYVRDNGAGFDPEYAHRLFAPFQRLHGDTEFEGTGIGLATVQRIVARHGGRVWAQAEEDKGATFYFTCGAG